MLQWRRYHFSTPVACLRLLTWAECSSLQYHQEWGCFLSKGKEDLLTPRFQPGQSDLGRNVRRRIVTEGSLAGSGVGILMRPVSLHFLARGPRDSALASRRCGSCALTWVLVRRVSLRTVGILEICCSLRGKQKKKAGVAPALCS